MRSTTGMAKKRLMALAAVLLFVTAAMVVSFQTIDGIPNWKRIYQFFGVADVSREADAYDLSVHFIDVGKADGIYIRCNGKHILIDSGDVEYSGTVTNYLKRQGVEVLEELVPDSAAYETMIYALGARRVPAESPDIGDRFSLGGMEIRVLGPQRVYDDMNDNSILLKMTYGEISFLFMGDAEENAEKDLLEQGYDLRSTVLKVGHHGSKTSTSQELLDAVMPQAAVISVGEDRNELPKTQVLDRLSENGAAVFRTDLNGTIVMASNGDMLHIFMEKDEEN